MVQKKQVVDYKLIDSMLTNGGEVVSIFDLHECIGKYEVPLLSLTILDNLRPELYSTEEQFLFLAKMKLTYKLSKMFGNSDLALFDFLKIKGTKPSLSYLF